MKNEYEIIIIGGGPAGLTAGIYTSRARLNSLLIEKGAAGGQIMEAEMVENFPGFLDGISGMELGQLIQQQAIKYGLNIITDEVTSIRNDGKQKVVNTTGDSYTTRAIIIASGSEHRHLGIPGEEQFTGKGVSYCATCDAPFFTDSPVAIVGGGNTAITEALYLAKFASKVTVIHRRDQLRAGAIVQERAFNEPRIDFLWDSTVDKIEGDNLVQRIRVRNLKTSETSTLDLSGIFIAVGIKPNTDYLRDTIELDDNGFIITSEKMETSVPGIFAAGDIRRNSGQQAITAAGDGAIAAIYAEKFLNN